jgi:glycosyltransferase involved in cell wall biosynthesis
VRLDAYNCARAPLGFESSGSHEKAGATTGATPAAAGGPFPHPAARVWDLQPEVQHYSVPIWDLLNELGAADGAYAISVLGTLGKDGSAIDGAHRSYFIDCPLETFRRLGVRLYRWPGIERRLLLDPPDVLIIGANPRNTDCWRIPRLCRAMGIPVVTWTKVHSYSRFAPLMRLLKPRLYSRFDCAVCYGESSREELVACGFPPDRAFVANNTVDTRRIFAQGERIGARGAELLRAAGLEGRKILLCIGRMDPEKRHQDLLDAWPRLRELDPDLRLVIVSGGPLLEAIRAKAAALDPGRILVTGRVPEGDDYAWISACDVGIYPGAVGLAINISLAFGRPTIIADERGADSEILRHGETGWRYPRGDLDAMVAAVGHVLANPEEAAVVGGRGRVLLRDTVTIDNMAANIDRAVRVALALRRPRKGTADGRWIG